MKSYIIKVALPVLVLLFSCDSSDSDNIENISSDIMTNQVKTVKVDSDGFSIQVARTISNNVPQSGTNTGFSGADPDVLKYGDYYYLYQQHAYTKKRGHTAYTVYRSKDLIHWHRYVPNDGKIFTDSRGDVWAPDAYYSPKTGKFYIYYTANHHIGVASADKPWGPFVKIKDLVNKAIDAHLFEDDDNKLYLYYTSSNGKGTNRIYVVKMATPEKEDLSSGGLLSLLFNRRILSPTVPWEKSKKRGIVETPFVIKRNGIYYLIYSGNSAKYKEYAIGYATSTDPMGPFKKNISNPIARVVKREDSSIYGPGQPSFIKIDNDNYLMIHHQKSNSGVNFERFLAIAPAWFDSRGYLNVRLTKGQDIFPIHILGYINPTDNFQIVPFIRFWSSKRGDHLYTTHPNEIGLIDRYYKYQGIHGYVHKTQAQGTVPLYRYWNDCWQDHLYTRNINELGKNHPDYKYEGIAGYVYSTRQPGTTPLYRYWNSKTKDHFYTMNEKEVSENKSYKLEGICCYIYSNSKVWSVVYDNLSETKVSGYVPYFYFYDPDFDGAFCGTYPKEVKYGPLSSGIEAVDNLIH